jgi:hypothetical protein
MSADILYPVDAEDALFETLPRRPLVFRYVRRHLGFLAGLLLVGVALGTAYRYLFDPIEQRTLPFFIRSCLHAVGLVCAGWALNLTLAAAPRSRLGGALRRLPLAAEFAVKAAAMTLVLTIVTVGLEFALYPTLPGEPWFTKDLPRILAIAFRFRYSSAWFSSSSGLLAAVSSAAFCSAPTIGQGASNTSSCSWISNPRPRSPSGWARCAYTT